MPPEMWIPWIDGELCTGCGDCVVVCPTGAPALVDGVAVIARPSACDYNGACETVCPTGAIALPYQIVVAYEGGAAGGTGA